jgi:hypothetical protein
LGENLELLQKPDLEGDFRRFGTGEFPTRMALRPENGLSEVNVVVA